MVRSIASGIEFFERTQFFRALPLIVFVVVSLMTQLVSDIALGSVTFIGLGFSAGAYICVRFVVWESTKLDRALLFFLLGLVLISVLSTLLSPLSWQALLENQLSLVSASAVIALVGLVLFFAHVSSLYTDSLLAKHLLWVFFGIMCAQQLCVFVGITNVPQISLFALTGLFLAVLYFDAKAHTSHIYILGVLVVLIAGYLVFTAPPTLLTMSVFALMSLCAVVRGWHQQGHVWTLTGLFMVVIVTMMIVSIVRPTFVASAVDPAHTSPTETLAAIHGSYTWTYDNHWLGYGPGSYRYYWDENRSKETNYGSAWEARHLPPFWNAQPQYVFGYVPTAVIETGYAGMVVWFGVLCVVARLWWQKFQQRGEQSADESILLFVGGALGMSLLVSVPSASMLVLVAVWTGWLASRPYEKCAAAPRVALLPNAWKRGVGVSLILIFYLGGILFLAALYQIEHSRSFALAIYHTGEYEVAHEHLRVRQGSIELPGQYRIHAELGLERAYKKLVTYQGDEFDQKLIRELLATALVYATRATELDPLNYRNWLILGDVHMNLYRIGAEDALSRASEAYSKSRQLSNADPVAIFRQAELAVLNQEFGEARTNAELTLQKKTDFSPAVSLMDFINSANTSQSNEGAEQ